MCLSVNSRDFFFCIFENNGFRVLRFETRQKKTPRARTHEKKKGISSLSFPHSYISALEIEEHRTTRRRTTKKPFSRFFSSPLLTAGNESAEECSFGCWYSFWQQQHQQRDLVLKTHLFFHGGDRRLNLSRSSS